MTQQSTSMGRLLMGYVVSTGVLAVLIVGSKRARRRLVPNWHGPEAWLAEVILVVSVLTVVSDIAGTFVVFRSIPVGVGCLVVGFALYAWGWGSASVSVPAVQVAHNEGIPRWQKQVTGASLGATFALWTSQTPTVYSYGILGWDSIWYHLPATAQFVQSGSFLPLKLYESDIVTATYPFGASVFHALGILGLGSDILSPLINLGWAMVVVLGAWVFGRRFAQPCLAVIAACVLLAGQLMVQFQASSALAEMMGLAGLVSAVAFLVQRDNSRWGVQFLIGLAAGLTAASKLMNLGPAATIIVGSLTIVVLRKSFSWSRVAALASGFVATGAFWYARNVVRFNNPIPEVAISLGPVHLHAVQVAGENILGPLYPTLLNPSYFSKYVGLALSSAFGPGWAIVVILCLIGSLLIVLPKATAEQRIVGFVALTSLLAGATAPQYVNNGVFQNLYANLRYVLNGVLIGLLASVVVLARKVQVAWAIFLLLIASSVSGSMAQPFLDMTLNPWHHDTRIIVWLWVLIATVCGALISVISKPPTVLRNISRVRPVGLFVVGAALLMLNPFYQAHRYSGQASTTSLQHWVATSPPKVIGVEPYSYAENWTGTLPFVVQDQITQRPNAILYSYRWMGPRLENRVVTLSAFNGTKVTKPKTCGQWWSLVRKLHVTDVLVWTPESSPIRWSTGASWTLRASKAKVIVRSPVARADHGVLWVINVRNVTSAPC